jgi:hypothetical protein
MATRFNAGILIDFVTLAFKVVSGNASGTTPKVSGVIKAIGVESVDVLFVTGASTNVAWSITVSKDAGFHNSETLTPDNELPTGVGQNSTVNIPLHGWPYFKITGTPSAGSGAVEATPTTVYGEPQTLDRVKLAGVLFEGFAADTVAGQAYLDYSANYNPQTQVEKGLGALPKNTAADPAKWFSATDMTDSAYAIPALVASTGQTIPLNVSSYPWVALRARFSPSSGFGRYRVTYNSKG